MDKNDFDNIQSMTASQLLARGCAPWSQEVNEQGQKLYLFPKECWDFIPQGLMVETISGKKLAFDRNSTADDHRLGYLAFGVRAHDPPPLSFWERLDNI